MNPTRIVPADTVTMPRNTVGPISFNTAPVSGAPGKPRSKDMTMYLGRDQTLDDTGVKSLQNAWVNKTCFVVIVGKKYGPFPWSPGYRPPQDTDDGAVEDGGSYAVLGWYRVKSYWCEYEPGRAGIDGVGVPLFIRWRFLFEWAVEQGVPWWLQSVNLQAPESVAGTQSESTPGML